MRGDRPCAIMGVYCKREFTPHARGSTEGVKVHRFYELVYPACAGIDLSSGLILPIFSSLPRMRGDRPGRSWRAGTYDCLLHARDRPRVPMKRTRPDGLPCMRITRRSSDPIAVVFTACGIDCPLSKSSSYSGLPRMRGDRPRGLHRNMPAL